MSVSFFGTKVDASVPWGTSTIRLPNESEDDIGFNLCNANALAFLRLLQVPNLNTEDGLYGALPIAEMAKLVQQARASFDYRVDVLCRDTIDTSEALPGGVRLISFGIDESYFTRRLEEFANLVADYIEAGADHISWG